MSRKYYKRDTEIINLNNKRGWNDERGKRKGGLCFVLQQRLSEAISETTGGIESMNLVRSYDPIHFKIESFEPLAFKQ